MKCMRCGADVSGGVSFCPSCGAPVAASGADGSTSAGGTMAGATIPMGGGFSGSTAGSPGGPYATCPTCGNQILPGDTFCTACGAAVPTTPAGGTTSGAARFCTACGAPLYPGDTFCTACGAPAAGAGGGAAGTDSKSGRGRGVLIVLAVVLAGVLLGGGIAAGIYFLGGSDEETEEAVDESEEEEEEEEDEEDEEEEAAEDEDADEADAEAEATEAEEATETEEAAADDSSTAGSSSSSSTSSSSSSSTSSGVDEQSIYNMLIVAYNNLDVYDSMVANAATNFNAYYLNDSYSIRSSYASEAESVLSQIAAAYEEVGAYDIPSASINYSNWLQIFTLYSYLYERIAVICAAWNLSLSYSNPSDYAYEIKAPLRAELDYTGNNKYYTLYNSLRPTVSVTVP